MIGHKIELPTFGMKISRDLRVEFERVGFRERRDVYENFSVPLTINFYTAKMPII